MLFLIMSVMFRDCGKLFTYFFFHLVEIVDYNSHEEIQDEECANDDEQHKEQIWGELALVFWL